jgi:tRNA-(ms[2]io[6]A)-hydroxylase
MGGVVDLGPIRDFLPCATPQAWIDWALEHPEIMLIDHANCEKKAASTALNLMYRYVEHPRLLHKLSRLAREELRHFEQVISIMQARDITYTQISASRYAGGLRTMPVACVALCAAMSPDAWWILYWSVP